MELKASTASIAVGIAGGLSAYFNAPEIAQAGEILRLGAGAAIGTATAGASYISMKLSVEIFGNEGFLPIVAFLAALGAGGYYSHDISTDIAGNIVSEISAQQLAPAKASSAIDSIPGIS